MPERRRARSRLDRRFELELAEERQRGRRLEGGRMRPLTARYTCGAIDSMALATDGLLTTAGEFEALARGTGGLMTE